MKEHLKILKSIRALRKMVNNPIEFYTQGHCYNFAETLKALHSKGTIVYDSIVGHMYYKYGNILYDVRGYRHINNVGVVSVVEVTKPHRWSIRKDIKERLSFVPSESVSVMGQIIYNETNRFRKALKRRNCFRLLNTHYFIVKVYRDYCDLISSEGGITHPIDNNTIKLMKYLSTIVNEVYMELYNINPEIYIESIETPDTEYGYHRIKTNIPAIEGFILNSDMIDIKNILKVNCEG